MQVVAVLKVLWDVSPHLVVFIILYSAIGTTVTLTGFGAPLMFLFEEALHREVRTITPKFEMYRYHNTHAFDSISYHGCIEEVPA